LTCREIVFTFRDGAFRVPVEAVELLAARVESELAIEMTQAVETGEPLDLIEAHAHAVSSAAETLLDGPHGPALQALYLGIEERI
jgi:hypothetical protein